MENTKFEEMERRLKADNIDFSKEKLEKSGITKKETFENYDLDECVNKITNYIKTKTIVNYKNNIRKKTVNYEEFEEER